MMFKKNLIIKWRLLYSKNKVDVRQAQYIKLLYVYIYMKNKREYIGN